MIRLLSGNEAIAQGAWEAGVSLATAYPGTPSTEIIETIAGYKEVKAEWSTNEKVALEVALGASFAGGRVLCSMKHVGLNVAADPFFSAGYIGVSGGLVIVTCDDPGMHSSQNEQDNRYYAMAAKVPLLEPSDSQEAKDFTRLAFEISERFDTPVLIRMTTRTSHSQSLVECGRREEIPVKKYQKLFEKRVLLPGNARKRHTEVEKRLLLLKEYAERFEFNRIEQGDPRTGIITSAIAYQYAREVFDGASFLKLSLSFPFPEKLVKAFAAGKERIIIIEELEPFIENHVRMLSIPCIGKEKVPGTGELNPQIIRDAFGIAYDRKEFSSTAIPARPPALCSGCPHTPVYNVLKQLKVPVTGDIGCYTLGALPPISVTDSCVDMGASIGNALGMEKIFSISGETLKPVAVIGDSTFLHSGIPPLIDAYYNKSAITVLILDNSTTAMTGHQENPATGKTIHGAQAPSVSLEALVKGIGIRQVHTVDPYDLKKLKETIRNALESNELSVVITNRPCVLHKEIRGMKFTPAQVDAAACIACRSCLRLGCPSISMKNEKACIDPVTCVGCGVCMQVCPKNAIGWADPEGLTIKKAKGGSNG